MKVMDRPSARRGAEVLAAIGFGVLAAVPEPGPYMFLLLGGAAIALGLWSSGPRAGLGGLAVLVVLSMARAAWLDGHWFHLSEEMPSALLRAGVPWLVTVALRQYVSLGRRADRDRDLRRRQRLAELKEQATAERLALARSLHDDLGHALSLVALNLGRLEVDPTLPRTARASLSHARGDLSRAVERLGDSVTGLRAGTPVTPADPRSVDALMDRARAAGARITAPDLPTPCRLDAFGIERVTRVLQEAITNANRHAPGEAIAISATDTGRELRVRISNVISTHPPDVHTSGTGLAALGRDIRAEGGQLDTRKSDGVFVLTAVLRAHRAPRDAANDDAEHAKTADDEGPAGSTKRTQRLVLAATAAVVVCGLAAVESLSMAQNHRALLPADDFSSISVGDTHAETVRILPDRELPARRGENRPSGCHDYAVTANPFDDAAGDVHRICFSHDVVSSVDHIRGESR
ncbi:sensor histidine kinase [Nocardiopsis sp. HUAS JQ3]|uniref:sensor histidine kinase n=1 Tax=Nocardiopsis sp. HUAS JQ3 TaxID=3061629 RepID=UPI0023A921F6|nr:histidine kinase [Nocardiopsis sp. HUAS JQ3]WDZ91017.1 histidine kinase [Nocardiopsis sp. HUAS JQ3]